MAQVMALLVLGRCRNKKSAWLGAFSNCLAEWTTANIESTVV
jgi:hypothetical protein